MKKIREIAALAVVAILSGLAGCGEKSGGDIHMENGSRERVIELTFYNADGEEDLWTDPVALELTKATGIKLKTEYPISSDNRDVELMIAEQNYPDIIYAKGDSGRLVEAGALIDLTELIEEYGPNIKKLYGEELDRLRYSETDPSIYQLSSYAAGGSVYKNSGTAQIQWAVLKGNGYRVPRTLADFEQMLKDYLDAHPMTEEGLERIGFTLSVSDWHWMITLGNPAGYIAEGAPDNGQWLMDSDYRVTYKFRSEKVRQYFKWLNRMYHEGILDPEFATQTHEDYIAKIASGRVLALMDSDWDYDDGERVLKVAGKLELTYAGIPLAMDEDTKAPSLMYRGLIAGQGVGITTACQDPVAAIRFLDYICSDEGQVLVNWGIEDVNYYVDEKGHRYRTEEEIRNSNVDKNYSRNTGVGFHTYPFPVYGSGIADSTGNTYTPMNKEAVIKGYDREQKAACEAWGVELLVDIFPQPDEFEMPEYSAIWAYMKPAELDVMEKRLDGIAWSGLIRCVIGKEEEFEDAYDIMIRELEEAGLDQAERMMTEVVRERMRPEDK